MNHPNKRIQTLLGNPKKAIFKLAWPMIVAMSVQTLYHFVDAFWVSGLGPDALSAVGFFFPFFFMILAIGNGLGIGGSSAVSRKIGANDKSGADDVASHTMVMMVITAVLITIPFFFLAGPIFIKMGAGDIAPMATRYGQIIFLGTLIIFFSNISGALLRGEGDANRAMVVMMVGAGLNIILDPIFIYTFKMGVAGAAWATLLSITISSCFLFYWLFIKGNTYINISFKKFVFKKDTIREILKVGIPSSTQQLAMAFSTLGLNIIIVKVSGTDGVAVFTTGWRVVMFAILPLIGLATALTAVAGAAYGGKEYKKLQTAHLYAVKIGFLIEIGVAALTFILAPKIAALFTLTRDGARIRPALVIFLRTMCIYYPSTSHGMLSSSMFQGIGKGSNALIITIFRTIILTVPLAYIFSVTLNGGLPGIWWGVVTGNISGAILAYTWARHSIRKLQTSGSHSQ